MSSAPKSGTSGGAAMGGGQRFQARVLAWWSARILLQTRLGNMFDLPATSVPDRVWAETKDSVDDVRVGFSSGQRLFGQCKTTIAVGTSIKGDWADALKQCVWEFDRASKAGAESVTRLVIYYENDNGNAKRLGRLLDRFRYAGLANLTDVGTSAKDADLAADLSEILDAIRAEASSAGNPGALAFLATDRAAFLKTLFVRQLRLADGQEDYLSVVDALQAGLLEEASQSTAAIESLHCLADDLIAEHGTRDRVALRNRLEGLHIALRESPDFRPDFDRLEAWTNDQLAAHDADGRDRVRVGATSVSLDRQIVSTMENSEESFLVIGEAGAGKSGALLAIAQRWRAAGRRVWYWAADALAHQSLPELAANLQLRYPWSAIFAEARAVGVVLIVDGIDGVRDAREQRAYRELLTLAQRAGAQVVASIRTFDVQYAADLRGAFPRRSGSSLPRGDVLAPAVAHITVPQLEESEIAVVAAQLPGVAEALNNAPSLREVVRNLFSLDLLCRLLDDGAVSAELTNIATQAQLFDRFWDRRITASPHAGALENALRVLVDRMVAATSLHADASGLDVQTLVALQSSGILRVLPVPPGRLPNANRLEFAHHVLFDYVAERVFVRPRRTKLPAEFTSGDPWPLFLRPSLVLFHRYAWQNGRLDFWDTILELEQAEASGLHRFAGYVMVADSTSTAADLLPLLDGVRDVGADQKHWRRALSGVINAVTYSRLSELLESGRGSWWLQLAFDLISTGDRELVYMGRRLLFTAADFTTKIDDTCRLLVNRSARLLIDFHRSEGSTTPDARLPIEWMVGTFDADPANSATAIRVMLEPAELARAGFIQVPGLANVTNALARAAPELTREVYNAAFGFQEISKKPTPMGTGVMPMRSNRKQDFEHARYLLDRFFPAFLAAAPLEATRAVIHIAAREPQDVGPTNSDSFRFDGRVCSVVDDPMRRMQIEHRHGHYVGAIVDKWAAWVQAVDPLSDTALLDSLVSLLAAENNSAAVWAHFFDAACVAIGAHNSAATQGHAAAWAERLAEAITSPSFLAGSALGDTAPKCVAAAAPLLSSAEMARVEEAILAIPGTLFAAYWEPAKRLQNAQAYLLQQIPPERRGAASIKFLDAFGNQEAEAPAGIPRIFSSSRTVTTESIFTERGIDIEESTNAQFIESMRELEEVLATDGQIEESVENESGDVNGIDPDDPQLVIPVEEMDVSINSDNGSALEVIDRAERRLRDRMGGDAAVRNALDAEILRRRAELIDAEAAAFPDVRVVEFIARFDAALGSSAESLDQHSAKQFDDMQSWPSSDRRISAANGIMALATRKGVRSPTIEALVNRLACDPDPRVRYQVAIRIWGLSNDWPGIIWATLERWVEDLQGTDGAAGVFKGVTRNGWFWWLRHRDANRSDRLLASVADAARAREEHELEELAGRFLGVLWFQFGVEWARDRLLGDLTILPTSVHEVSGALRELLDAAVPDSKTSFTDDQRSAAVDLACRLTAASSEELRRYDRDLREMKPEERPSEPPQWAESLAFIGSALGRQLSQSAEYIAKQSGDENRTSLTAEWWKSAAPLLGQLLMLPLVEPFYSAIEAVIDVASADARTALHWIAKLAVAGESVGGSGESMIADQVIPFLARTLATEGGTLGTDGELRADFLAALDVFLRVGWPGAIDLALKIETLYR